MADVPRPVMGQKNVVLYRKRTCQVSDMMRRGELPLQQLVPYVQETPLLIKDVGKTGGVSLAGFTDDPNTGPVYLNGFVFEIAETTAVDILTVAQNPEGIIFEVGR